MGTKMLRVCDWCGTSVEIDDPLQHAKGSAFGRINPGCTSRSAILAPKRSSSLPKL